MKNLSVRDAVISRRSIKNFNGQAVDRETLYSILEDATWAPNHGNREPWRVVVACGEELPALHTLLRNTTIPKWQELSEEALDKQMQKFTTPGAYVFAIVPEDARQKERLEDFGAVASFLQNIQLLAWDQGIGSCWKTPPFIEAPAFREALGVKPGERVLAMLQLGHYDEEPKARPRKPLADIITVFWK